MRKILCLVVILLTASFVTAITPNTPIGPAVGVTQTDAMMDSLGIGNANIVSDYNIWINPARVSGIPKKAYAEIWQGNTWGGSTIGLPVGTLGVFVGRPYIGNANAIGSVVRTNDDFNYNTICCNQFGVNNDWTNPGGATLLAGRGITVTGAPAAIADVVVLTPNTDLDLFYALPVGPVSVGLRITQAANSAKVSYVYESTGAFNGDGTITSDKKSTDMQTAIGATMKDLGPFSGLDVAIAMAAPTVTNSYSQASYISEATLIGMYGQGVAKDLTGTANVKSNTASNMSILVRGTIGKDDGNQLIASLMQETIDVSSQFDFVVDYDSTTSKEFDVTGKYADKTTGMNIGVAYYTKPADSLKVIYIAGMGSSSRENKYTATDNLSTADDGNPKGTTDNDTLTETRSSINLGVALEHQTFKKVKTRIGVTRGIMQTSAVKIADLDNPIDDDVAASPLTDSYDRLLKTNTREDTVTTQGPTLVTAGCCIEPTDDIKIDLQFGTNAIGSANALFIENLARATVSYSF